MDADEEQVKRYLEEKGLSVEPFSKDEMRAGKTPDFRVKRNGELAFYCEVKSSPPDSWLHDQLGDAAPGELVGGQRRDPVFNRIAKDIYEAVKQFDAVNKDQKYPNVLVLVNHDDGCDATYLENLVTGNFEADDGTFHQIYWQYSDGSIRDKKERIHLFIWLDDHTGNLTLFNSTNESHHPALCALLNIDQSEIRQIGP